MVKRDFCCSGRGKVRFGIEVIIHKNEISATFERPFTELSGSHILFPGVQFIIFMCEQTRKVLVFIVKKVSGTTPVACIGKWFRSLAYVSGKKPSLWFLTII